MNNLPQNQQQQGMQRPPRPPPPSSTPSGGQIPHLQNSVQGTQRPMMPPPPPGSQPPVQGWRPPASPANGMHQPGYPSQQGAPTPQYRPVPRPQQPIPQAQSPGVSAPPQQQIPPHMQQHQHQQQNMAALAQQMGGMGITQPLQQDGQSPPLQPQSQKQRPKRVYPTANPAQMAPQPAAAGYPPVTNPQTPGFPGTCVPGYPSPAGAPISGPQTFVPGAQVPAPMPSAGQPYARSPAGTSMPVGAGGIPQAVMPGQQPITQPAQYEPQKPRIDPNQMPSPKAVHAHDQEIHGAQPYSTALKTNVPLACTRFTAIDEGNSNPRFVRLTMYNIPHTEELLKASHLPLGIIVQPLADLASTEEPVKLIDFGEEGPIRCLRCKTYINPHMAFINGGKNFVCNMCSHENAVPEDYFCNLDMAGMRLDRGMRPELSNGTVEFVATKDFINRQPVSASFVFAIDVTWSAVQNGLVAQAAAAIKDAIYGGSGLPPDAKVGIITFDRSAHFYSLLPSLDQAQMMVVPDIQDVFVPINDGFVVDPYESQHVIESLLDSLPSMFAKNRTAEPVLGAVVQVVHEALRGCGGKLFVFQTAMPTFGPGSLKQRDDPKLHNTEKERALFEPQDTFYHDWAVKFVEEGICCNLYMFPSAYMDAATISQLSTVTGGELYSYPGFDANRDGKHFAADLRADVQRTYGGSAVLRIRTSDGLRIDEHYGNLFMRNHVDVELAGVTSDSAIGAVLQYDGKLDEKQDVYFQIALLYTTSDGQRRIRVHNLAVPCTTLIGNMFRHSEVDTSMNLISKMAVSEALTTPLKNVREKLTDRCVQILTAYRRNCASGSSPGQLILPEQYKLSPLYTLALLKSPAIRGGADVPIDQRIYHMCLLRQFSVHKSMDYFYPQIVPLHSLAEHEGVIDETSGVVVLPAFTRASYTMLDPAGAYLLSSGGSLAMWVGRQISPSFVQEALGFSSVEQIDATINSLPKLDTVLNQKINAIAQQLLPDRAEFVYVQVIRQGMDQAEVQFASKLVEDRNNDNMTYVDFVCAIHRQIQVEVRPKGPVEPKWSYN
ncbi:COPII coat Sec23p-Sfb3p heterodimer component [Coemansia spiralis]|uniref:COPII coat Sec23p-Sfb3p heterodimer component n=2 Tax=Coemansia TaxID=4863 RepID=A0A9W8G6M0_9FUNG|nr:Sec23/Sec24 trunk domain-containing protein [Coemansia spiralis]KAJ1991476.1 COPII coat Sec23p-Sfb3p heterodimer component [Coemansia umbellata]KAJ2621570.1 COPII coat Sec23p-Sfb3p heterodimer component [Coemansia sp. RSA 1358]KAJ2676708.1 COPII coat Sec23p-Sfb3p heterodimer component [Coemansia spiralis]